VLRGRGQVEIEIEASERITPHTNLVTGPDRLIVDFVGAVPSAQLKNQNVGRGDVRSLRVGLFSSDPPVTRIVLDLNGPQPYQVFPSGRTVIVKVGGPGEAQAVLHSSAGGAVSGAMLVNSNYPSGAHLSVPVEAPARPSLEVSFRRGLLSISSYKANLSEVLFAIHQQTGAEIAIPAGAEQEQVVAEIGPVPASEALSQLLNGSKFNFLILSSTSDPRALDRVILSSRPEGPMPPPPRQQARAVVEDDADTDVAPKPAPSKAATPLDKSDPATDKSAGPSDAPKPATGDADPPNN
jgi:hypothetical protein